MAQPLAYSPTRAQPYPSYKAVRYRPARLASLQDLRADDMAVDNVGGNSVGGGAYGEIATMKAVKSRELVAD